MKRKLVLMLVSFVMLLLGLTVYQFFVPSLQMFDSASKFRRDIGSFGKGGENPTFIDYDKQGAKRGVFSANSWTKHDDGSLDLYYPTAVLYQKDGTRTYLKADQGQVLAEQVAGGFNVRSGKLFGNVVIYFDQSQTIDAVHPDDRTYKQVADNCIRIVVDEIEFTRDMLQIKTRPDTEVSLWSRTVDLVGVGLTLRWNESPRELRLLEISKMKSMLIKELPEEMNMIQLPGQDEPQGQTNVAAESKPAPVVTTPATKEKEKTITVETVETADADNIKKSAPTGYRKKKKKPTVSLIDRTAPSSTIVRTSRSDPEGRNVYRATFHDNVTVDSGNRRLTGADILAMTFEWDTAWRADSDSSSPDDEAAATKPAAKKDKPQVAVSDTVPAATDAKTKPTHSETPAVAATPIQNKVEIHCTGKLTIEPVGKIPNPSRKRYTVSGKGKKVLLSEPDACIVCHTFRFESPAQEASFTGTAEMPIRLMLARGEEIISQDKMRFCRTKGKGYLDGPGQMLRYVESTSTPVGKNNWDRIIIENDENRPVSERIKWAGGVEISFTDYQAYKDGKPQTDAKGKPLKKPGIQEAIFRDKVVLMQLTAPSESDPDMRELNFVNCDRLNVWMKTELGKNYLDKATASGNVSALQGGNRLSADETTILFRPKTFDSDEKSNTGEDTDGGGNTGLAAGMESTSVEPAEITISGNVDITYPDPENPKSPPLRITGDYLNALMIGSSAAPAEMNQLAVVTGRPAKVWQGDNAIEGTTIYFDRCNEGVLVEGPGKLLFKAPQRSKDGTLKGYKPVEMTWAKNMQYHGKPSDASDGYGIFEGGVDMRTDKKIRNINDSGELVRCEKMQIFLRKPEKASSQQEQPDRSNPMGIGMDDFGARVFQIEAKGGKGEENMALLQMQKQNPKNSEWVLQRQELRAEEFIYNIENQNAVVQGAGKFLAEDYNPPSRAGSSSGSGGMTLDTPSQTIFSWAESMRVDQQGGHIALVGNVEMHSYTGSKLRKTAGIKFAPLGRLNFGRINALRADKMDAWFAKSQTETKDTSALDGGVDSADIAAEFGALKLFKAIGSVTFTDSEKDGITRIISGQRIIYEASEQLITVFGYLEGQKESDATITLEDLKAHSSSVSSSPALYYYMDSGKVKVKSLKATGGAGG